MPRSAPAAAIICGLLLAVLAMQAITIQGRPPVVAEDTEMTDCKEAEWKSQGVTYTLKICREVGETEEAWCARFEARLKKMLAEHPPD